MERAKALAITENIFSLYERYGDADYIGEPVSQLEHMCQAALLAEEEGFDEEVILAAFFHDIGHLAEFVMPVKQMDGVGVVDHEKIGSDYLRENGFSEKICKLVQSHVQAKRYLTFKYPGYYEKLSPASKLTLTHQGGAMGRDEAIEFESDEWYSLYIKLREWDDKAKEINKPLPDLSKYKAMALGHLLT